ncbi:MAG TPA: hypothetical protein VG735_09535 [Caulobacterales bacterium]|nr:hypothetical protein [Caulobacterales bacterium]
MRLAVLSAALVLAGCASAPPNTTGAPKLPRAHGVRLTDADRADPAGALRRAGAADAMTPEGAHSLFGTADVERVDGAGALLTYRTPTCALALAFAADGAGDLRLGAVEAAARDQRAPRPPLEQCVTEALARRVAS